MLRYKKKSANIEKPKYRADYAMKEDGKRKIVQGQSRGDGWKGDCCSLRPWRILSTGLDSPPIGIEIEEKWKKLGYSPRLVPSCQWFSSVFLSPIVLKKVPTCEAEASHGNQ